MSEADARRAYEEQLLHGGKVMSVWEHLAELRTHLVRALLALAVTTTAGFFAAEPAIRFLERPLVSALPAGVDALHFTGPLEVFMTDMKVGLILGILFGCPVCLWEFWRFFEPALYPRERRYVLPFIVGSTLFFFLGIAFSYFVMLPLALSWLIGIGLEVGTPLITLKDYVSMLLALEIGVGLVFEAPLIVVLLGMLDLVSVETLRASRKFVLLVLVALAAVLTPPDVISQIALTLPLYAMFELAILALRVLKRFEGKKAKAA
jgi:sec-independent protein translocase protein TatC